MIYSPRPKCMDPIYDYGPSFVFDYTRTNTLRYTPERKCTRVEVDATLYTQ